MPQTNDLSRCLIPFRQDETLVAVVEMSKTSWLVSGIIPGGARHPLKKLVSDEKAI
jgi:transposase